MKLRKRPHRVLVTYKSGAQVMVRCAHFAIKRNAFNAVHTIEWENARPRPLQIGVDDVESVWQVSR